MKSSSLTRLVPKQIQIITFCLVKIAEHTNCVNSELPLWHDGITVLIFLILSWRKPLETSLKLSKGGKKAVCLGSTQAQRILSVNWWQSFLSFVTCFVLSEETNCKPLKAVSLWGVKKTRRMHHHINLWKCMRDVLLVYYTSEWYQLPECFPLRALTEVCESATPVGVRKWGCSDVWGLS